MNRKEKIREQVRENYGRVAREGGAGGCCQAGCGCKDLQQSGVRVGYLPEDLDAVPEGANLGLGCGNPTAIAGLQLGETVLDLGCGGGFDCFLAQKQVGEHGYVIGVDMTPDMINLARENAEKIACSNVEFRLGEIEHLPVADQSVDVIISNCVLNLSLDKEQVLREAYRVLKAGGRLAVTDVVAVAEMPASVRENPTLIAGCIGGAEKPETLERILKEAGFTEIQLLPTANSKEIVGGWDQEKDLTDCIASYRIQAKKKHPEREGGEICCGDSPVPSDCC